MEQLVRDIVKKVRNMYQYTPKYKDIVAGCPTLHIRYTNDETLELMSIQFNWWDSIIVNENGISYHPEYGNAQPLISYNGFDELLKL